MVEVLLAILAAYGMGVGLVHLLRRRGRWGREETSHAVIVVRDAGATVEWHLRAFAFAQWLRGRHTKITLIDEGSTDETVRIVERLVSGLRANWVLITAGSPAEAKRWLEQAGEANEVLYIRGPAPCSPAGTTI